MVVVRGIHLSLKHKWKNAMGIVLLCKNLCKSTSGTHKPSQILKKGICTGFMTRSDKESQYRVLHPILFFKKLPKMSKIMHTTKFFIYPNLMDLSLPYVKYIVRNSSTELHEFNKDSNQYTTQRCNWCFVTRKVQMVFKISRISFYNCLTS